MDAGTFFKRVASVLKENPPAEHDAPALERLKKARHRARQRLQHQRDRSAIPRGLETAMKEVQIKMPEEVTKMKNVNGWMQPSDMRRYGKRPLNITIRNCWPKKESLDGAFKASRKPVQRPVHFCL